MHSCLNKSIKREFFDKLTFHLSDGRFLHIGIKTPRKALLKRSALRGVLGEQIEFGAIHILFTGHENMPVTGLQKCRYPPTLQSAAAHLMKNLLFPFVPGSLFSC